MSDASNRISADDAAQQLGISTDEILGLRRRGKIRGYPDYGEWVFEETDVAELAAEMGIEPAPPDEAVSETVSDESPQPEESPTPPPGETADSPYRPASLPTVSGAGRSDRKRALRDAWSVRHCSNKVWSMRLSHRTTQSKRLYFHS